MVLVGVEARLAEMVAGTGGAAIAPSSDGAGVALVARHPKVEA